MGITVNGITYTLIDDCESLIVKLDNKAYDCFMEGDYNKSEKYNADGDTLRTALDNRDYKTMRKIFNEYCYWFKRYR